MAKPSYRPLEDTTLINSPSCFLVENAHRSSVCVVAFSKAGELRGEIDLHEGEAIDEDAFKALIRAAVSLNKSKAKS